MNEWSGDGLCFVAQETWYSLASLALNVHVSLLRLHTDIIETFIVQIKLFDHD